MITFKHPQNPSFATEDIIILADLQVLQFLTSLQKTTVQSSEVGKAAACDWDKFRYITLL